MTAQTGPIIGVTTQTLEEIPDELPRCWIMSQRYVRTLTASGAVPWIIPLLDDPETLRAIYDRLDGIFLPGGVDIDPDSYNENRDRRLRTRRSRPRPHRDHARGLGDEGREADSRRVPRRAAAVRRRRRNAVSGPGRPSIRARSSTTISRRRACTRGRISCIR